MLLLSAAAATPYAHAAPGSNAFSNATLIATAQLPDGYSTAPNASSTGTTEPAIAFGADGSMLVDGLAQIPWQVNLWKGRFGATPSYFGAMDTDLKHVGAGRTTLGGDDADVEFTSAGTTLLADLDVNANAQLNQAQLGVNVTRCPRNATSPASCTHVFLDSTGTDRPWLTTAGTNAWVSYHDAQASALIRVKRSTDDGASWKAVGSPIAGQGAATGDATFNNDVGPIVADPSNGMLYEAYDAGETQTKASSSSHNNVYVSRSTDGGISWTAVRVFHAAPFTALNNFWPALALDPVTHALYTTWTDQHGVYISSSTDTGVTWSAPQKVSSIATTAMPNVAARGGKVDVVYYGTTAASIDATDAIWNAYDSQLTNGAVTIKRVSQRPNHVGPLCLEGSACTANRQLADLFEVAEDPLSGKAAVAYTDSTIDTYTGPDGVPQKLPEIVVAFEK